MNHDTDFRSVRATGFSILGAAIALLAACSSPETAPGPSGHAPGERIGTYDGRAVVIAYANGPRFAAWLRELREQHDAAVAAGEVAKAEALEQRAVDQQERFHDQAFRGDDVDDVLALVADAIPSICADAGVVRLEQVNRERPDDVETVDVTDRLVALFEPSDKGREWIAQMREQPFPK